MPAQQANKWGLYSQDIKLKGMSGRYLLGQARQVVVNKFVINNVSWDWQEHSLLFGKLALMWKVNDTNIQGQGLAAQSAFGDTSISDANLTLNTEVLNRYLPKGNKLAGNIDIKIDSVSFNQQLDRISAKAKVNDLTINTKLGIFKIEHVSLEASGSYSDGFDLRIIDFTNENLVNVVVEINKEKVILSGSVSSQSDLAKQLKGVLPFVAKKQGNNWQLSWKGLLPNF
ncbi:MAG: type II secretion system protein GspN [Methylophaga sp.]|nr:type II secretion system protein GspN [Methylophaga sp.]